MSIEAEIALQRADDEAWAAEIAAHLAQCIDPIPLCRTCSDYFGMVPG